MAVGVFIYIRMHKLKQELLRTLGIFSLRFVALDPLTQSGLVVAVSLTRFGHRVSYWWSSGVLYCLAIKVLALPIHFFSCLFPQCMWLKEVPVSEKGSSNLFCYGGALSLSVGGRGGVRGGQQCEARFHDYHENRFQRA